MDMKTKSITVTNASGDEFTFSAEGRFCKVEVGKTYRNGLLVNAAHSFTLSNAESASHLAPQIFGLNSRGRVLATNSELRELQELVEKFLP